MRISKRTDLKDLSSLLKEKNFECPARVLRIFVSKLKNIPNEQVMFAPETVSLSENELERLGEFVDRYNNGEPESKIINCREFWKDAFFVDKNVLDPRPETEIIIEVALKLFSAESYFNFLDAGTGSGCILLSLAREFPNANGIGIDISESAVAVANKNKENLKVKNAEIVQTSWNDFSPSHRFDLIVSNPPYIKSEDIVGLDKQVREFDPLLALDGGKSGLDAFEQLAPLIKQWINPNGHVLLEIGIYQKDQVRDIFNSSGFRLTEVYNDLQGIPRVLNFVAEE